MTKINIVVNESEETKIPQFRDLDIGQYFRVISDYYDEDMHLYIKLPLVQGGNKTLNSSLETLNSSLDKYSAPEFYNCFDITANKLDEMSGDTFCDLIDNVEIRI